MADDAVTMDPIRCPECGTLLTTSRLDGLCPVCLLEETAVPALAETGPAQQTGPGLMHLPGYQLLREIARGGMGIIYEAAQATPSRTVAIKMLLPHLIDEPSMRERFRREAQSMAGLDHPGILPVYEVGDHNGLPYFSMKLAAGGTLSEQAWRYRGQFRLIAGLLADLADAIQTAHAHGVLHRDLKPGNILFDEQGRAYLSDFGIAKQLASDQSGFDLTKSATLLGTPNYLPPEWAAGTARSPTTAGDLYGLGAILYQLLTGDPPHRAGQLTTLLRKIADDPVTPPRLIDPGVPRDLEIICLKALAKDPSHRYAGAHELAEDLRLWLTGRPIRARAASLMEKSWRWSRRNPLPASLAVLLAGALTIGGSVLWNALQTSRQNLHNSLVAQASALRETGRLGNRTQSIEALERAISLRSSNASQFELSSALAMTDLRERRRFPYGDSDRVHTNAAFTCYTSLDNKGHVTVCRLTDNAVISRVPGDITDPEGFGPFSPDGRFLCLRPLKKEPFTIWDCQENTFRHQGLDGTYYHFSPDNRTLAIGHEDGRITLMDVITGAILSSYPTTLIPARPYSFSPDGTRLIVGQFKNSRFQVLETGTGRIILSGEHPPAARVRCAAWMPDGNSFFIGTESFKIYQWSFTDNSLPRQYTGHHGNVFALAVHPGGEWLLSQSEDGTTRLWSTANAQTAAELPYFGAEVRFSADGRQLLCEDRDAGLLHLVDLSPSSVCRQFALPHPDQDKVGTRGCWFIAFSPDGGLLSVGDTEGLLHFDGHTAQPRGHARIGYCWSLGWAMDGSALYSVSRTGLQRWPVTSGSPDSRTASVSRTLLPPELWAGENPDPLELWTGEPAEDDPDFWTVPVPELPGLWSGQNPEIPQTAFQIESPLPDAWTDGLPSPADHTFREKPAPVRPLRRLNHLAVSDDHGTVALAYDDYVGLFAAPSGQVLDQLPAVEPLLDALALNPDGSRAAASHKKAAGIPVWDTKTGHRLHLLPTRFPEATVRFHPDGTRLFTGDLDAITCWNVHTGAQIWRVPCPARSPITVQCELTPDGTLLATNLSPETIHLLDPADGREITRLRHPSPQPIAGLAFSPDHSRLAALCLGHLVQLWDLQRLREELAARSIDWPHPPLPAPRPPLAWSGLDY